MGEGASSLLAISQIITQICTLTDLYTPKRIIRPEENKHFVSEIMSYDTEDTSSVASSAKE